jgi:hypothetical protein
MIGYDNDDEIVNTVPSMTCITATISVERGGGRHSDGRFNRRHL